ncbi:hypothetical protein P2S30_13995 [Escherichia coli]
MANNFIQALFFAIDSPQPRLLLITNRSILTRHLQNQVPGLEPREMLQATYDAPASFLCRALGYTSMVGWAGAP